MKIRARTVVKLPATLQASGGLKVAKTNGIWTFSPDWLVLPLEETIASPGNKHLWIRDATTGVYTRLSVQYLISSLPPGPAGTLSIGPTGTLAAGSNATATNTGTPSAAIFNLGIPRGADAGLKWAYETSTVMAPPAIGGLRFNNAVLASVTAIAVNAQTADSGNPDQSDYVVLWDDSTSTIKGHLYIREENGSAAVFSIGAVTDNTTWLQLTVAYVSGAISLTAADPLYVVPLLIGNKGTDGAGTGDFSSNTAISVDSEIVVFSGVGGKTGKRATTTGILKGTSGVLSAATDGTEYLSSTTGLKQGKTTIWVPAAAMTSRTTNGAAAGIVELTTNKNMVRTLDYDAVTTEYAQFDIAMPLSWNEGTISFIPYWSHPSTTVNFGVSWYLDAVAISTGDALDVAFGVVQASNSTGGATNTLYIGAESAAVTIAGVPQPGDNVQFRIYRNPGDAFDTMAVDARLHGVKILFTLNAATD